MRKVVTVIHDCSGHVYDGSASVILKGKKGLYILS